MAGSFVPECAFDQDEIRRIVTRTNLTGGGNADKEFAAGREKLFRDQNGERCADRMPDNPKRFVVSFELIEVRVIARPSSVAFSLACSD